MYASSYNRNGKTSSSQHKCRCEIEGLAVNDRKEIRKDAPSSTRELSDENARAYHGLYKT